MSRRSGKGIQPLSNLRISSRYHVPEVRLLAAILSGETLPQAVPTDQWQTIIDTARAHSLLPMLLWTVKRAVPDLVSGEAWEEVLTVARNSAVRHVWHEYAQTEIERAFREAAIPVVWLKGVALARMVYPQPALRPMGDIDALISYERCDEALALVRSLGFEFYEYPKFIATGMREAEQDHHYRLQGSKYDGIFLELHFRIINDGRVVFPLEKEQWFLTQIDHSIEMLPTFKPEAFLLHLCAHAVLHHGEDEGFLSRFFDIHRLVIGKPVDWALFVDQAVKFRWSSAAEYALLVTKTLFHTPIPDDVFTGLESRRLRDEDTARILGLQGKGANMQIVLGMLRGLTFPEKLRLLRDLVIPPAAYMRARYNIPPNRPVWSYYPRRWLHQAGVMSAWLGRRVTFRIFKKPRNRSKSV